MPTDRRTVLVAAGAAAVAAAAGPVSAQSGSPSGAAEIRGSVTYLGGGPIPKGVLVLSLDAPADAKAPPEARIPSDGDATAIAFALPSPATATAAPAVRIVARLERPDGWLLARGSAIPAPGAPVEITLAEVMY
ncbi:hypothetical protein [Amaricoccus sp.]|uniref:hypothetical protein n=1 Tax=Amaricoccus sp. TaxID=1872485 RepID=UPI001B5BA133|nr:hypothetical protein [Amaricoccus sp.]MBP7003442.1 hypothetical protein [Amaricoccus sp.]